MGLRWEYRWVSSSVPLTVVELNALGEDGWEVCAVEPFFDRNTGTMQAQLGRTWLFKRVLFDHPMVKGESARAAVIFPGEEGTQEMPAFDKATVQEKPKRAHQMSEENRAKAAERMRALAARQKMKREGTNGAVSEDATSPVS